jgi:2-methylcitrate dehydratase PrpD
LKKFLAEIIAEYVERVQYNDIPRAAIEKTKLCILDSIGCALGGSTIDEGHIVISSLLAGGLGSSTIFGHKEETSLSSAVFINSTLSNILDFDDFYIGHPGATIIPVALNVGELRNTSGKDIITAVALGYEIAIRIGLGLRPTVERRYVHGHGTWQVFGATVTASKLFGLNTGEIANALGIAGANAPVPSAMKTVYGLTGPTMAKNNFGTASEVGVISALLARNGFTGPKDIFDGETSFWRMIGTNHCDLDRVLRDTLSMEYKILNVAFKPYPCCRLIHSSIEAIINVLSENDIVLRDVEKIVIKNISPLSRQPFSVQEPKNMTEAQFSSPYTITCAIRNIDPLEWYKNKNILDNSLLEMAKKIESKADPNADKAFQNDSGKILATAVVYVKNGKKCSSEVGIPKGDPRNALTEEAFREKFKKLAVKALNAEGKVISLMNTIMKLEELENIKKLTDMLS